MKSSRNGTKRQEPKKCSFTADEVCCILDKCSNLGIATLTLGDLHFQFKCKLEEIPIAPVTDSQPPAKPVDLDKEAKDALVQDELRAKEDRLAMLLVEDPQEFERQICAGELTEDDGEPDEDAN
jgi:hypothetical protein